MATITLVGSNLCSAGNHFDLTVTGDYTHETRISVKEVQEPITEEEKEAFLKVLLRVKSVGATKTQIRNALAAGVDITI